MDNPFYESCECCTSPAKLSRRQSKRSRGSKGSFELELGSSAGVSGSQASMALDLHDCQVTLKVKDESANKRSDTSRRHQLLRQKPVEDDIIFRCSCIPRFLCAPVEERSIRTKSSTSLKSPCRHCLPGNCYATGHISKITPDYRSQSFSQTYAEPKKNESARIFCIDDHCRGPNLSSENIRACCEENLRCWRRHSPCASPFKSPKCRTRDTGCLVRAKESCDNGKPKKISGKMKGTLSAEDQSHGVLKADRRSASFSPTTSPYQEAARKRRSLSSPVADSRRKEEAKTETKNPS